MTNPTDSPLGRFLLDPAGTIARLADSVLPNRTVGMAVGVGVVAATIAMVVLRRRWTSVARARFVGILPPAEVSTDAALSFWANLHDLLRPRWRRLLTGQPHVGFEYLWRDGALRIGVWTPTSIPVGLVERAVESAWPGARTVIDDPPPAAPDGWVLAAGELHLADSPWLPLCVEHPADPLRAVIGAAGYPSDSEAAVVQVLARPATWATVARCRRAAREIRNGRPASLTAKALDVIQPGPAATRRQTDPAEQDDVRRILVKARGPLWHVAVRYAVADAADDDHVKARLRGRAHVLASAFGVFAGRNRFTRCRLHHPARSLGGRLIARTSLLSVAELAALAHLPTDAAVPGLVRARARSVAPVPTVPSLGKVLGDTEIGVKRPVALAAADARQHLHVVGKTGSGKSTLLTNLFLADAEAGRGAVLLDPKGDLVNDILDRLPPSAASRVVLLDPADDNPPTLNVLAGDDDHLIVDALVSIFQSVFEQFWGPRTDDVFRAACLTLRRRPDATLAQVPRLLSDPNFRRPLVESIRDPAGLGGFWAGYDAMSVAQQAQVVAPLMNKLRAVLLRPFVRQVLDHPASSLDIPSVLDGGLLLARLPKGVLGEDTSRLLGSILVARVWQAALARARHGQSDRADATLYLDECQNYLHLPGSVEDLLAEARGYRLGFVLAHQHLGQLPRDLRAAVSANARNKVIFNVSPEDAAALERHVAPELSAHDLASLDAFQAAARLVVAGAEVPAFTLRTRPAASAVAGRAAAIRHEAQRRHGRRDDKPVAASTRSPGTSAR